MIPGAPAGGWGEARSVEGFRVAFVFGLDLAGDVKKLELLRFRPFCVAKLLVLLFRLLDLVFNLAGVAGGDTRAVDAGSGGWLPLRSRASISSLVRFTFVCPFTLAHAIQSRAASTSACSLGRAYCRLAFRYSSSE